MNELLAPAYKPPTSLEQLLGFLFPEITKLATEDAPAAAVAQMEPNQ